MIRDNIVKIKSQIFPLPNISATFVDRWQHYWNNRKHYVCNFKLYVHAGCRLHISRLILVIWNPFPFYESKKSKSKQSNCCEQKYLQQQILKLLILNKYCMFDVTFSCWLWVHSFLKIESSLCSRFLFRDSECFRGAVGFPLLPAWHHAGLRGSDCSDYVLYAYGLQSIICNRVSCFTKKLQTIRA